MSTLKITAKGQVTFRKDLLRHLGVAPGEEINVEKLSDGRVEVRAAAPTGTIADIFNSLKRKNGPRLSVEDISRIAARNWSRKT